MTPWWWSWHASSLLGKASTPSGSGKHPSGGDDQGRWAPARAPGEPEKTGGPEKAGGPEKTGGPEKAGGGRVSRPAPARRLDAQPAPAHRLSAHTVATRRCPGSGARPVPAGTGTGRASDEQLTSTAGTRPSSRGEPYRRARAPGGASPTRVIHRRLRRYMPLRHTTSAVYTVTRPSDERGAFPG
ncbi:hypothetical protein GCM10010517_22540 [Streptosporangium fragile]|uniref:Uncharacterized protein n=1 Tax=Streptosporangium fragile TaxID=46186 RepID=A0ABN3VUI9_9ACTN